MQSSLDQFLSGCSTAILRSAGPLWKAYCFAHELHRDPWEFAVGIDRLRAAGLEDNDLRWLVHKGFIACAVETKPARGSGRRFRRCEALAFPAEICFILTAAGAVLLEEPFDRPPSDDSPVEGAGASVIRQWPVTPLWDAERRELRFAGQLVKQFKVPAPNQELILASFQEQDWPQHVDDPLPPLPDLDSKRRLHDTISRLNRKQKRRLLRFRGDGRGSGLYWEPAK